MTPSIDPIQTQQRTDDRTNIGYLGERYSQLPWPTHWNKAVFISVLLPFWPSLVAMCKDQGQRMSSVEN